jgi:two-component system response regulator RpfG
MKLAKAGEYRDEETGNHIIRMAKYARLIAEELRLTAMECDEIETAAPMHDIGKIGISDLILLKPGRHTPEEQAIMRRHPLIGHGILTDSPSRYLQMGAVIALGHHEKFDGSGYPQGLAGEGIPLPARIVAVADAFDGLPRIAPTSRRGRFRTR